MTESRLLKAQTYTFQNTNLFQKLSDILRKCQVLVTFARSLVLTSVTPRVAKQPQDLKSAQE